MRIDSECVCVESIALLIEFDQVNLSVVRCEKLYNSLDFKAFPLLIEFGPLQR